MNTATNIKGQLGSRDKRLVSAMQLLGDNTRYKMFKLMSRDSELCVSQIAEQLGISAPAVSQHFRIFELVGLVDKQRTGQKICYSLKKNDELVDNLTQFLN
jgi:ArsR family transcriptional regulator